MPCNPAHSTTALSGSKGRRVRCPGHAIQFLKYDYTEYTRRALGLAGVDVEGLELKQYEDWTPYQCTGSEDRVQRAAEDEPRSSEESGG